MSEKPGNRYNNAFESFLGHVEHEARIDGAETLREHALRLIGEVHETFDDGVISQEEATALIAKLDVAYEATLDSDIRNEVDELRKAIITCYPGFED